MSAFGSTNFDSGCSKGGIFQKGIACPLSSNSSFKVTTAVFFAEYSLPLNVFLPTKFVVLMLVIFSRLYSLVRY